MSRPSTSSTLGPSRQLSTFTESYDGDTESLTHTESQGENFNCNESLASPTFPVTLKERNSAGDTSFIRELSPQLFESETETGNETSTSNTSIVDYTDSEFSRVKRPVEELIESAEISQSNEGCLKSETANCDNRNDTASDGLSTLLFHPRIASDETPHMSFYGHVYEANSAAESSSSRSMFSDSSLRETSSENIKSSEKSDQQPETEQEIKEKQRAIRNNFREIVKEARKTLRQTRAKRRTNETSSGRSGKAASKQQNGERVKINNAWTNSKQNDTVLKDSAKVKDVWVGKRTQGSSKGSNLLKQRKRQECLDIEKIQVQHLITELTHLKLHEQAADIKRALTLTEEKEKEFDTQLEIERQNIRGRKSAEKWNQKQEAKRKRLEEIRIIEAARKEKEAIDRQRRVEEAKRKREHNRMLWKSYNAVALENSLTRSYTFSYFPKLRLQPIEHPEPKKRTHADKVREAREKYGGLW